MPKTVERSLHSIRSVVRAQRDLLQHGLIVLTSNRTKWGVLLPYPESEEQVERALASYAALPKSNGR